MRLSRREKQVMDEILKNIGSSGTASPDLTVILERIQTLETELTAAKAALKELTLGTE